MKWLWNAQHYWPLWMAVTLGTFLLREVWALASGRSQDTLSQWVWAHLHIVAKETIGQWSATDVLLFGVYVTVFVVFLPYHFWFHKF